MAELVHYQTCGFLKLAEVGLLEDSGCLMSLVDVEVHVLAHIWAMAKTLQWWWLSQGFPTRHLRSVTTSHLLGILNDYIPCSLGRVRSFYNYCYTLFSPSMMFLLICSMSNGATKSMCVSVTKHSRKGVLPVAPAMPVASEISSPINGLNSGQFTWICRRCVFVSIWGTHGFKLYMWMFFMAPLSKSGFIPAP